MAFGQARPFQQSNITTDAEKVVSRRRASFFLPAQRHSASIRLRLPSSSLKNTKLVSPQFKQCKLFPLREVAIVPPGESNHLKNPRKAHCPFLSKSARLSFLSAATTATRNGLLEGLRFRLSRLLARGSQNTHQARIRRFSHDPPSPTTGEAKRTDRSQRKRIKQQQQQ